MGDFRIELQNLKDPSPKVLLMYQAVSELIRGKADVGSIKVLDITQKAGIGKGTAYEYFSSKEELIASALVYDYGMRIQNLAQTIHVPGDFREQCYKIMDWLVSNKEYNKMFSGILQSSLGVDISCASMHQQLSEELIPKMRSYIESEIDLLMQKGIEEGVFVERNQEKLRLAFLTAMVQYAVVMMDETRNKNGAMTDEQLREFVYQSLTKSLN